MDQGIEKHSLKEQKMKNKGIMLLLFLVNPHIFLLRLIKISFFTYNNCQMSAKIDEHPDHFPLALLSKSHPPTLAPETFHRNHSDKQTERLCLSRENPSQNLEELFLKETERNAVRSHFHSPVVLTDKGSASISRNSSWRFDPEIDQQDEMEGIEYFLQKEGLLDVFNSFQTFRSLLIESLSEPQQARTTRTKVSLFQAITDLKADLVRLTQVLIPDKKLQDSLSEDNNYLQQVKAFLLQISSLRKENDDLRVKLGAAKTRLKAHQSTDCSFDNSLINNSISYMNSSLCSSEYVEEVEPSIDLRQCENSQSNMDSMKLTSKSTTISLENSLKQGCENLQNAKNILEEDSYEACSFECSKVSLRKGQNGSNSVVRAAGEIFNSYQLKDEGYALISHCIKTLKDTIRLYFQASNLALLRSPRLDELQTLLSSYKTFKADFSLQTQKGYMRQASNLLTFIQAHSLKLSLLIQEQIKTKTKAKSL